MGTAGTAKGAGNLWWIEFKADPLVSHIPPKRKMIQKMVSERFGEPGFPEEIVIALKRHLPQLPSSWLIYLHVCDSLCKPCSHTSCVTRVAVYPLVCSLLCETQLSESRDVGGQTLRALTCTSSGLYRPWRQYMQWCSQSHATVLQRTRMVAKGRANHKLQMTRH